LVDPKKPDELIAAISVAISDAGPRKRNDLVETFDVGRFRARVSDWMNEQAALAAA
jgi:hypothetical protein